MTEAINLNQLSIAGTNGLQGTLDQFKGQWLILYFYPKDATPGCTLEGQQFRDKFAEFQALNAVILGVSRDSTKSHDKFKAKECFPFELISDENEQLCQAFDVIKMKNMYGKQVRGIERSTFLFNPQGQLVQEWRKVSVDGHVDAVLASLSKLSAKA